jgi:hypothetical protein
MVDSIPIAGKLPDHLLDYFLGLALAIFQMEGDMVNSNRVQRIEETEQDSLRRLIRIVGLLRVPRSDYRNYPVSISTKGSLQSHQIDEGLSWKRGISSSNPRRSGGRFW